MPGPAGSGLKTALELLDMGIALRAERFRRENPMASEAEAEALRNWPTADLRTRALSIAGH